MFDIMSNFNMDKVVINDQNAELINTYKQIKINCTTLIFELERLQKAYIQLNVSDRKTMFLNIRIEYNRMIIKNIGFPNLRVAAFFIFLNKTCFNGLYRVNSKGEFNTSFGYFSGSNICNQQRLLKASELLQNVIITSRNYSECKEFIDDKTLVYIDPPYKPVSKTADFTHYTKDGFSDQDQLALKGFVDAINSANAKVVVSNSDCEFIRELYSDYNIDQVTAARSINRDSTKRGPVGELLITN